MPPRMTSLSTHLLSRSISPLASWSTIVSGSTGTRVDVYKRQAKAVRALIARGEASADDYPLLLHVDDIIERGKAVDIPWNKFELETL